MEKLMGYSGEALARFTDGGVLGRVFVMLHRDPLPPEGDAEVMERSYESAEDYQEWWGT